MFFPALSKETILNKINFRKGLLYMEQSSEKNNNNQLRYREDINNSIKNAQDNAAIGNKLGVMSRQKGIKRRFAQLVGNLFLRVARIITRDQRIVNQSLIDGISVLRDELADQKQDLSLSLEQMRQENKQLKMNYEDVINDLNKVKKDYYDQLVSLKQNVYDISNQVKEINAEVLPTLRNNDELISSKLEQIEIKDTDVAQDIYSLKALIRAESERVSILLKETRKFLNNHSCQDELVNKYNQESQRDFDGLYLSFENLFRGSREEVKNKVEVHLNTVKRNPLIGQKEYPILDIGCGRGEWLELLKEKNMTIKGLDINRAMVEYCNEIDLPVAEKNVFDFLKESPDESIGAVTGFHIIEHLEFPDQYKLLEEIHRVLKPGGLVLLETPNPKNIIVGSSNFNGDPTHIRPVFPDTLKFLYDYIGFVDTDIHYLNPMTEVQLLENSIEAKRFNELMYCAQDFATVGWKV